MPDEPQNQPEDAQAAEQTETDNLPEVTVDVSDAGTLKKKLTVTIPRGRIDAKMDEMFGELGTTAQIPGFRVGRAPRRLIEKRFAKEVSQDVRNSLIGESIGSAIDKSELSTMGEPDLDLEAIELPDTGDMLFDFEVEVSPEFDLPETKGIKVEKQSSDVTDERIDEYLDQLRQERATFETTDEPADEGDTVVASATISGEGIETVTRDGQTLRVAPGQIEGLPLVDLGDALKGTKAGGTASVSVKVPEAHPNTDWHGKELTVEIAVQQVNRRVMAELDAAFATNLGFESLEELREFVAAQMKTQVENETRKAMREQISEHLLNSIKLEVPEGVAARHAAKLLQRRASELMMMGVSQDKIQENLTSLQAAAGEQADRELKMSFILEKVAKAEGVEIDEGEVNAQIAQMAARYRRRPDRIRQELASDGTLEQLEVAMREEKALDKLLEQADITEVAAKPAAKKTAKKAASKKVAKKADDKPAKKPAAKKAAKKVAKKTTKKASSSKKPAKDDDK